MSLPASSRGTTGSKFVDIMKLACKPTSKKFDAIPVVLQTTDQSGNESLIVSKSILKF